MSEITIPTCPKCGRALPYSDPEDSPADWARECNYLETECPYVPCDDLECRALRVLPSIYSPEWNETSLAQFQAALTHWRGHSYTHGCSHGR